MAPRLLWFLVLLLLGGGTIAAALDPPEHVGDPFWQEALARFQEKDYGAARAILERLIRQGGSRCESSAWLLLGKCYLHLDMPSQAEESARKLIAAYPHGRYAAYAHYLIAETDYLRERFFDAALDLLTAAQITRDDELNLIARAKLERLFEHYLSAEQQSALQNWVKASAIRADLAAIQEGYRLAPRVGVILPLSGSDEVTGQALLAGIEAAASAAQDRLPVEIIPLDSRGDIVEAVRAAQFLIAEEGVVALIGELNDEASAAVGAVAAEHGVPLIVPASSDLALTRVGENVFQLLADCSLEGATAAEYLYRDLGVTRVAILAPTSDAGAHRAEGFQDYYSTVGVTCSVQWYYKDADDFRRQIAALSQSGAAALEEQLGWRQSQALPAATEVSPDTTLPLGYEIAPDSAADLSGIRYYEALYVPVQGDELALLAPQLAIAGYDGILVGSTDCIDRAGLAANRRYLDNMIFPSHFAAEAGFGSNFPKAYGEASGAVPNRWNVLGWDAFNFLAQGMTGSDKLSPRKVLRRLEGMREFQGARADLLFGAGDHRNHALYMIEVNPEGIRTARGPMNKSEKPKP